MKNIVKILIPATFILGPLAGFSWIFGGESLAISNYAGRINPRSFNEYVQGSRKVNGDHFYVDVLTAICYPGYLTGVKLHNLRIKD